MEVFCLVDPPTSAGRTYVVAQKSHFESQWSITKKDSAIIRAKGHVLVCATYYFEEFYFISPFCM